MTNSYLVLNDTLIFPLYILDTRRQVKFHHYVSTVKQLYLKFLGVVTGPVTDHAVFIVSNEGGHSALVISIAFVGHGGVLEFISEVLGSEEDNSLGLAELLHDGLITGVREGVFLPQLVRGLGKCLHYG